MGFAAQVGIDICEEGSLDLDTLLIPEQIRYSQYADLYVNGNYLEVGYGRDKKPYPGSRFAFNEIDCGIDAQYAPAVMATSWATPIALSFFNFLKLNGYYRNPKDLKNRLKLYNRWPRVFNPLKLQQLEVFVNENESFSKSKYFIR